MNCTFWGLIKVFCGDAGYDVSKKVEETIASYMLRPLNIDAIFNSFSSKDTGLCGLSDLDCIR